MSRLVLAAAVLLALPCSPQSIPRGSLYSAERKAAADAAAREDQPAYRDALAKIHADFPENSRVIRNLAIVEVGLGNSEAALNLLRRYAAMGCTLDLKNDYFAALREPAKEVPQLARNDAPATRGSRVFRLADPDLLVEDVTYDPAGKRFFLSSVHQRKILSCDAAGACQGFIQPSADLELGAILAVSVDARHGVLWATTAGMEASTGFQPAEEGQSALLRFDLRTRRLLQRFQPDDGRKHAMGDMTVAANGDVFVSDGLSGDVFTVAHQGGKLEKLAPAGMFLSPQTPALSADGKSLYVPDYVAGIAVLRLSDRHIEWLKSAIPAALEGIDGLYNTGGGFIAVQNGVQPPRIVELHLDARGELDKLTVLEANWPGLGEPTHGVQVGREFYFIVNSGWDRVADGGVFKPGEPAELWKLQLSR